MNNHNLALLSDDDRAFIELHKGATLADHKGEKLTLEQEAVIIVNRLKNGAISRDRVKKLIDNSFNGEKLRNLINKYRRKL